MAREAKKIDLPKTIKPGDSGSFEPVFNVASVEGRERAGSDYVYARLEPAGGGAGDVGVITLRMPAILAPGSSLASFCRMVGQDPNKGFDPSKAVRRRVRVSFTAASTATE